MLIFRVNDDLFYKIKLITVVLFEILSNILGMSNGLQGTLNEYKQTVVFDIGLFGVCLSYRLSPRHNRAITLRSV